MRIATTTQACRLEHGDAFAGMRAMLAAGDVVDHVITDTPYSRHVHANGRSGATSRRARDGADSGRLISVEHELGFDALTDDDRRRCAELFARLARRWVLVFSDIESCHLWRLELERAGLEYVRTVGWSKLQCAPQFTGDRPAAALEVITVAHQPGRKRWNGGGKRGMYPARGAYAYEVPIVLGNNRAGEERLHKTQKPLALMRDLVRDFTDRGELILDPFAGVATTAVAARQLGRRFVGFERDRKYFAAGARRVA